MAVRTADVLHVTGDAVAWPERMVVADVNGRIVVVVVVAADVKKKEKI